VQTSQSLNKLPNYQITQLPNCHVSSYDRLVQAVPVISGGDPGFDLLDHPPTAVAVCHDRHAVAFQPVRAQIAAEAPVAATVREVPALATLRDCEAHPVIADAHWIDHLLRERAREHAVRPAGN